MKLAVSVIYHHFPHYRAPVMRELSRSQKYAYRFYGSLDDVKGVKAFKGDEVVSISPISFSFRRSTWVLKGYWRAVTDPSTLAIIVHGHPNMPASWLIAIFGRIIGKKILFWAHGWIKKEPPLKAFVRNLHYGLAHRVLTYGVRARELAERSGFSKNKVIPIFNSLDFDKSTQVYGRLISENRSAYDIRHMFERPEIPLIICTARLTAACRFDLLLNAASDLKAQGLDINVLLVGDGPELAALRTQVADLRLPVFFYGACYDEEVLGGLIFGADLTVSPGKIGLTAIHSLSYGTPAITHDNFDEQMPEYEAIEEGVTGAFFKQGDASDLARAIKAWLGRKTDRNNVRESCRRTIATTWNPARQRVEIEKALDEVFGKVIK